MKIVREKPPIWDRAVEAFPSILSHPTVIFCWGDTIYAPGLKDPSAGLPEAIIAHEKVHSLRQGDSPEKWWDQYLINKEFRFYEELLAHVTEYEFIAARAKSRNERRRWLAVIAEKLASPIYGSMIQRDKAKLFIKGKIPATEKEEILNKLSPKETVEESLVR